MKNVKLFEEYNSGVVDNTRHIPKKLYITSHLGNTFKYLGDNMAYASLSEHNGIYSLLAYSNKADPKITNEDYELIFDTHKMRRLGFKLTHGADESIRRAEERGSRLEFETDEYYEKHNNYWTIEFPPKYVKPKQSETDSSMLINANHYITGVNVFLNNYGWSDTIDGGNEGDENYMIAVRPYGEEEFYKQESAKGIWDSFKKPARGIKVYFYNAIKVGDNLEKIFQL